MKLQIKVKYLIIVLAVLGACIWAFLGVSGHKHQLELDRLSMRLYGARDSIATYQIKVEGMTETVYQSQLVIIDKDKDIFRLEEEGERLRAMGVRRVRTIASLETEVRVLRDSLKPEQGGVVSLGSLGLSTTDDRVFLPLPNSFSFKDSDVSVSADINLLGEAAVDVELRDPLLTLTLGSAGAFKNKRDVALVTSDNPYVVVSESNVIVVDKQKAPASYFLTGTAIGAGVAVLLSLIL